MSRQPVANRIVGRLRSARYRDWFLGLLLVAVTFLAFWPALRGNFIWDDDYHLTNNPCIIGPIGFKGIWTSRAAVYYPLVLTSFWIQHAIWGLDPLPYHLVNIAMHVACAILLWQVLQRLNVRAAWLGAALWALHQTARQPNYPIGLRLRSAWANQSRAAGSGSARL